MGTSRKSNKVGSKPVNKVPPKKRGKKQMSKSRRRDNKALSIQQKLSAPSKATSFYGGMLVPLSELLGE